jgi:hypothetical protein
MPDATRISIFIFHRQKQNQMSTNYSSQNTQHMKLRPSTTDVNKWVNDRGDRVKVNSATNINVNGYTHYSAKSAANAINNWGSGK